MRMQDFPNAETISEQVLTAAKHSGPPTNLKAVCSLWSGLQVAEEALEKPGYLIPLGAHGAEVLLRKNDPLVRKQFTLAHELGHWILANLDEGCVRFGGLHPVNLPFVTDHNRRTPEEIWCNRFASCLLMPRRDVQDYLGFLEEENVPQKISRGHSTFRVSKEAFLARIPQVTPINVFEVVSFDGAVRVRRKFLCDHHPGQTADLLANRFLEDADPIGFPAPSEHVATGHRISLEQVEDSRHVRSWLMTIFPL